MDNKELESTILRLQLFRITINDIENEFSDLYMNFKKLDIQINSLIQHLQAFTKK